MKRALKEVASRSLPPESMYWLRSVKRAVLGQKPLAWPFSAEDQSGRILQEVALERYRAKALPSPLTWYGIDDILILAAQDIARALTLGVQYINGSHVNGDVAEFGTMGGFTANALAISMVFDYDRQPLSEGKTAGNPFRKLRLFDSFQGLPEITSEIDLNATHVRTGAWSKGSCKVLAASELSELVGRTLPSDRYQLYDGWFADTVPTLPPETRFALIHFDGDLYQSTMDALDPLFERVMISKGCMLFMDDWNANRADPTTGERKAWAELVEKHGIVASSGGDYSVASTRFIIHSYRNVPAEVD